MAAGLVLHISDWNSRSATTYIVIGDMRRKRSHMGHEEKEKSEGKVVGRGGNFACYGTQGKEQKRAVQARIHHACGRTCTTTRGAAPPILVVGALLFLLQIASLTLSNPFCSFRLSSAAAHQGHTQPPLLHYHPATELHVVAGEKGGGR